MHRLSAALSDRNACKLLALIILASLAASWRGYAMMGHIMGQDGWVGISLILLIIFLLGLAAGVGLWRCRAWGFVAFYVYVVLATIVLGISIIPILPSLFSGEARVWPVVALNALVLIAGGVLHWRQGRRAGLH